MTTEASGRWWYLDLAAEFPGLEIYTGHGWGPAQELGLVELGERVMTEEAMWLPTWFYSKQRDRHWAAVNRMLGMVIEWIRDSRPEAERILRVLAGDDPQEVRVDEIPPGWVPDADTAEENKP
jgi:hypothetical protein